MTQREKVVENVDGAAAGQTRTGSPLRSRTSHICKWPNVQTCSTPLGIICPCFLASACRQTSHCTAPGSSSANIEQAAMDTVGRALLQDTPATGSSSDTAAFFGFIGASSALVFACPFSRTTDRPHIEEGKFSINLQLFLSGKNVCRLRGRLWYRKVGRGHCVHGRTAP